MDYLFDKLKTYKQVTKLSYKQMSTLLGISVSQLHALLTDDANQTFRQRVYTEFTNIIETLRFTIDESLWPEIFMPRLAAARWIFWVPQTNRWETLPDTYGQPKYNRSGWTAEDAETGELTRVANSNPALFLPKWPKQVSPAASLLSQEEDGWNKVNHLPMKTQASFIIINARKHLLGG